MAAPSAIEPEHSRTAGTDRAHSSKQHRRCLLSHLHIHVPVPTSSGSWSGRPSGPASAPSAAHDHHQDRPAASPSLLRSPTAWIRSKGHGFGSGSGKHTPGRRPGSFHYDARSYAQNFDDGGAGGREEEDALKQRTHLSPRILASPHQLVSPPSPSNQGISGGGGGSSNGEEQPPRETLRVME